MDREPDHGVATASGEYADICSSTWISRLRITLMVDLQKLGIDDFDASVLQKTAPRTLTQAVSRIAAMTELERPCGSPDVLFRPIKSSVRPADAAPESVVMWTIAETAHGEDSCSRPILW
jgi:hypothetical protein